MPSSRRMKVAGFALLLTILTIFYITNGASNTHNSPFYTRTVEALKQKEDALARENVVAEERQRRERVERIQKEHDKAVADAVTGVPGVDDARSEPLAAGEEGARPNKKPVAGAAATATAAADKIKPVAGRKTMKDDRIWPAAEGGSDGVAKLGNVEGGPKGVAKKVEDDKGEQSDETLKIETELGEILLKSPMVIFSKSYCPYSKKAKHILLDLYNITPKPFVVELDQHPLGAGLQNALLRITGRRTVPNILINGHSIGGGDDVQKLHDEGELADLVLSKSGKSVTAVAIKEKAGDAASGEDASAKKGLRFKA